MAIPTTLQDLCNDLQELSSTERFEFLIELAKQLPIMPEKYKNDHSKIIGCASSAWVFVEKNEHDQIIIWADADALIAKGFLALLVLGLSGQHKDDIINIPDSFLQESGVISSLSPSRANGALSSFLKIKKLTFDV